MMVGDRVGKLLLGVFWVVGMPMLILGCAFGIPRALNGSDPLTRAVWALIPTVGFAIAIGCVIAIMRRGARGGTAFELRWLGRYYIEVFTATALYIALCVASIYFASPANTKVERVLLALAPTIGILAMGGAIIRWIRSADEYHRQRLIRGVAVGGAATAMWTMSYGFLETAGFPRLSMFWVWPVLAGTWGLWSLFERLRTDAP